MPMRSLRRVAPILLLRLPSDVCGLSDEMQQVLDKHNVYRCMHGVPALTWDADIASSAQAWADNGQYKSSAAESSIVNAEQLGENILWGYPAFTGTASTVAWYSEVQYFDSASATDSFNPVDPTEHYRQVVWQNSTKLGCGKGKASIGDNPGDFWVCRYSPSGNAGQIGQNVLAATRGVRACGGTLADLPGGIGSGISWSGTGSGGSAASGPLPSACTPDLILPVGSLCVYGYQCASSFCCPRRKVCLESSASLINSSDTMNLTNDTKALVDSIVFTGGSTCSDPWSMSHKCTQNEVGQPFSTWDQLQCGCKPEYMARYLDGTWVTLNRGVTCEVEVETTTTLPPDTTTTTVKSQALQHQASLAVVLGLLVVTAACS